jgi:hypothetical protein
MTTEFLLNYFVIKEELLPGNRLNQNGKQRRGKG